MNSRTRMIMLIIFINLALIATTAWWLYRATPLSINCQGQLTFKEQRSNNPFDYDGQIMMNFNPDGSGYFTMAGYLATENDRHKVSRQENFNWRHLHDNLYEIHIQNVQKFTHDHVPDGLFEAYTAGIIPGQKRMLSIESTKDNTIVIGNFYSPLLLCSG